MSIYDIRNPCFQFALFPLYFYGANLSPNFVNEPLFFEVVVNNVLGVQAGKSSQMWANDFGRKSPREYDDALLIVYY